MISAVVLTKNEEKNIDECLDLLSWCDEIVIIDDNSTDKTIERARARNARIFTRALNEDFAEQRNYGLEKATNDWVLFIDADERVPLSLSYEVLSVIGNPTDVGSGYKLRRIDWMWGKQLRDGEVGNIK